MRSTRNVRAVSHFTESDFEYLEPLPNGIVVFGDKWGSIYTPEHTQYWTFTLIAVGGVHLPYVAVLNRLEGAWIVFDLETCAKLMGMWGLTPDHTSFMMASDIPRFRGLSVEEMLTIWPDKMELADPGEWHTQFETRDWP